MDTVSEETKRTRQVLVRFSEAEYETLKRRAESLSRPVAQLVRLTVLKAEEAFASSEAPEVAPRLRLAPSADESREPHTTEFPIVALAAAGSGRGTELLETGETVHVPNTLARIAARRKWEFVRIVGDSMEPTFFEDDIVAIEPTVDVGRVRSGDVCYFRFNGDPQIKELRVTDSGRRITLLPRNTRRHEPLPLLESDTLELVGIVRDLAHRADAARKG